MIAECNAKNSTEAIDTLARRFPCGTINKVWRAAPAWVRTARDQGKLP